jgi:hypothetical protein
MLFPSTLVISSDIATLTKYLDAITHELGHYPLTNNPDVFLLNNPEDYTIENIRRIRNFLSQNPYSHSSKMVIIPKANLLNPESQNTLLKNLEEPGPNNYFVLATNIPAALLPTIISRCHLIRLNQNTTHTTTKSLLFPSDVPSALSMSDTLPKNKDDLLSYFEDQLLVFQQLLIESPSKETTKIITKLIKTIQMVKANVEPRAAIDFLLLS